MNQGRRSGNWARLAVALPLVMGATGVLGQARIPDAGRALETITPPTTLEPKARASGLDASAARPAMKSVNGTPIQVAGFRVVGATLLSADTLAGLLDDLKNKATTLGEINDALQRLQAAYAAEGYFLAQAYLPEQEIRDGILEIAILEGRLGQTSVSAAEDGRTVPDKVGGIISGASPDGEVLHEGDLERGLLLATDLPGVEVRSTLVPGATVGTADLKVQLVDGALITGYVEADNYGSRYNGYHRAGGQVNLNNPSGYGDQLSVRALSSFKGLDYWRVGYAIAVGDYGTKIGAAYSRTGYELCCEFDPLEARGHAKVTSFYTFHPVIRSRQTNLYGSLNYDHKALYDRTIVGTTADKRNNVWTLGLSGDHLDGFGGGGQNNFSLAYASGDLDLGRWEPSEIVDALTERKQGRFGKLNYSLSRVQRLTDELSFYAALSGQFSNKNLDSSEKFVLGGPLGVRAYAQGEASGDEGHLLNLELRWDFGAVFGGNLQFAGFFDAGSIKLHNDTWIGWRGGNPYLDNRYTLKGAGVAANWGAANDFLVRASYARQIGSNDGTDIHGRDSENSKDRDRFWLHLVKSF